MATTKLDADCPRCAARIQRTLQIKPGGLSPLLWCKRCEEWFFRVALSSDAVQTVIPRPSGLLTRLAVIWDHYWLLISFAALFLAVVLFALRTAGVFARPRQGSRARELQDRRSVPQHV